MKLKAGSHQTSHLPAFDPGPPHLQNSEKLISIVYKLPRSTLFLLKCSEWTKKHVIFIVLYQTISPPKIQEST